MTWFIFFNSGGGAATVTKTVGASAALQATVLKTTGVAGVLQATVVATVGGGSVLLTTAAKTAVVDATLRAAVSAAVAADARLLATVGLGVGSGGTLQATITKTLGATALLGGYVYARPASDISAGSWTNEVGGTTNLYASIDEVVANDTDYIQSAVVPSNDTVELALSTLDPTAGGTLVLTVRAYKA